MISYIINDLLNELDLHFRMQAIFQRGNKNSYDFMNTKRYDIFSNYVFYCNLHDKPVSIAMFNDLLDYTVRTLKSKGYDAIYNTDNELLEVTKCQTVGL